MWINESAPNQSVRIKGKMYFTHNYYKEETACIRRVIAWTKVQKGIQIIGSETIEQTEELFEVHYGGQSEYARNLHSVCEWWK